MKRKKEVSWRFPQITVFFVCNNTVKDHAKEIPLVKFVSMVNLVICVSNKQLIKADN